MGLRIASCSSVCSLFTIERNSSQLRSIEEGTFYPVAWECVGKMLKPPELSNGESTKKLPQGVVYGVVRRSDPNQQKEMVVYGWSTNQLKEEMNYIKDVSDSRMFCFLCFEVDRRVESEAWMGMLSRHFESLIWDGNVSPSLYGDA